MNEDDENDDDEQLLMLSRFPYLEPQCKEFRSYSGYISAGEELFRLSLEVPHYPNVEQLELIGSPRIKQLLQANSPAVGDTLFETLCNVQQAVEEALCRERAARSSPALPGARWLREAALGLLALGAGSVAEATPALDRVTLRQRDEAGRRHRLALARVGTGANFTLLGSPELPLPHLAGPESSVSGEPLSVWLSSWRRRLAALQPLWAKLAALDEACWVVDPVPPSLSHTHRRIAIGSNVWAQVTLDTDWPNARPEIKLFGPEAQLQPMTARLQQSLDNNDWDQQRSLPDNLLSVLGLDEFPTCPTLEVGPEGRAPSPLVGLSECSVCFETRDQSQALPEQVCESDACPAHFHASCLFQWLDALRCQIDYQRIRGNCPNCDAAISCPVV